MVGEDRRSRLGQRRADVEVAELRVRIGGLEAGPAEIARARQIGNAIDLLPNPRADVADPDVVRSGLDREAEGIAEAEADDPTLVGVGRGEEGIARHGLAGHGVHAKDGAVKKTRLARRPPRALAAQRAALGRGLAERGADWRRGISAGIRGRVVRPGLSRYRNGTAELSPVPAAEARPFTGADVELPVGAEGERAGRVAAELLAPAFEQHLLGPRGLGRQKARELARDDAAVRAGPRSVGRGGTGIGRSADDAPLRHRSSRQGVAGIEDVDVAAPLVRRGGVEARRDREAEHAAVAAVENLRPQVRDDCRCRVVEAVEDLDQAALLRHQDPPVREEADSDRLDEPAEDDILVEGLLFIGGLRGGRGREKERHREQAGPSEELRGPWHQAPLPAGKSPIRNGRSNSIADARPTGKQKPCPQGQIGQIGRTGLRNGPRRRKRGLLEPEGPYQEHGHLPARHGCRRAVEERRGLAAAGHSPVVEVLDPRRSERALRHIPQECSRRRGRNVVEAEQRLEEEDGHLAARDGLARAVLSAAAADADLERGDFLHPRARTGSRRGRPRRAPPRAAGRGSRRTCS